MVAKGHNYGQCQKCGKNHIPPNLGKHLKGHPSWNKGLTKFTSLKMAKIALKISKSHHNSNYINNSMWKKGCVPWNKGLTKETDERVARYSKLLMGHSSHNPNVFNEWREKNGIVNTYPPLRFVKEFGHGVRSSWEEKFVYILKRNKIEYLYEKKTFTITINKKNHRYTPDFFLTNKGLYIEIKGFIRSAGVLKLNTFVEQYPDIELIVIGLDNNIKKEELKCRVVPWIDKVDLVEEIKCL